jgi:hypothetical protein
MMSRAFPKLPPVSPFRLRADKPHIYRSGGYWRVTHWPRKQTPLTAWIQSNDVISRWNAKLLPGGKGLRCV